MIFYNKDVQLMFEVFQYIEGWLWYSQVFQQVVGRAPRATFLLFMIEIHFNKKKSFSWC